MSTHSIKISEVVANVVQNKATKANMFNFYHTWYGWMTKGVLHIKSTSAVAQREIWHFDLAKESDSILYLKNTTSTAACWSQIPAHEEKEPYERLMRLCGFSKKNITYGKPHSKEKFTEKQFSECNDDYLLSLFEDQPTCGFATDYYQRAYYKGETFMFAVDVTITLHMNRSISKHVNHLYVNPNMDIFDKVSRYIATYIHGLGADYTYLELLSREESFYDWVEYNLRSNISTLENNFLSLGEQLTHFNTRDFTLSTDLPHGSFILTEGGIILYGIKRESKSKDDWMEDLNEMNKICKDHDHRMGPQMVIYQFNCLTLEQRKTILSDYIV